MLGGTTSGTISSGQEELFQINLPAGDDVHVLLNTGAAGGTAFYESFQQVASPGNFDQSAFAADKTEQSITLNDTQPGTYYVLIVGTAAAGSATSFSILGQQLPFDVTRVSPAQGENAGPVTLTVSGDQFTPGTTVSLIGPGGSALAAEQTTFSDSNTLFATFNLQGLAVGSYSLQASTGSAQQTLNGAFSVITGTPGQLEASVVMPATALEGREVTALFEYTNIGGTDLTAPLVLIQSPDGDPVRFSDSDPWQPSLELQAISPALEPGVLAPGQSGQVSFEVEILGAQNRIVASVSPPADPESMDYATLRTQSNPQVPTRYGLPRSISSRRRPGPRWVVTSAY